MPGIHVDDLPKLGKAPAKFDSRRLRLARYTSALPAPPDSADWIGSRSSWGVMKNDSLGDCTITTCGHAVQIWTGVEEPSAMVTPTDDTIVNYYSKWDGYDPTNPASDQGGMLTRVLDLWRQQGFDEHTLTAYADPQPHNSTHIKQSIFYFGGVAIGLALPVSAQNQSTWDVELFDGGVWGGHAVYVAAYDDKTLTCITWGEPKQMTWAFWDKYCDEAHALLSPEWHISKLDFPTLSADLAAVTG